MKIQITAIILSLFIVLGVTSYLLSKFFPYQTAKLIRRGLIISAGLKIRIVQTEDGSVRYLEGGRGPTILFLHGIYARKEHWIDLTRKLTDSYHVILLDLPGFGENPVLGKGEYDYEKQKRRLVQLLSKLKIDHFHIAASSMGGQIAGMLAKDMPKQVLSIAFIGSPAGVTSPEQSDMEIALTKGTKPLIVKSKEDYRKRMKWLFPKVPFIPEAIVKTWASEEAKLAEDNVRIWYEVAKSPASRLEDIAPEIAQPALIIWCQEDRIFHVSGAQKLSSLLPNSRLKVLKGCGHVPMLDKPSESAEIYRHFLDRLSLSTD